MDSMVGDNVLYLGEMIMMIYQMLMTDVLYYHLCQLSIVCSDCWIGGLMSVEVRLMLLLLMRIVKSTPIGGKNSFFMIVF